MRSEKRCENWIVRQKEETHTLILGGETLGKCRSNHLKEKKVEENAGKHLVNVFVLFYALFHNMPRQRKSLFYFLNAPFCVWWDAEKGWWSQNRMERDWTVWGHQQKKSLLEWIFIGWSVRKVLGYDWCKKKINFCFVFVKLGATIITTNSLFTIERIERTT